MLPRRHNRTLFTRLVRQATGTSHPLRGIIDSSTGDVSYFQGAGPTIASDVLDRRTLRDPRFAPFISGMMYGFAKAQAMQHQK